VTPTRDLISQTQTATAVACFIQRVVKRCGALLSNGDTTVVRGFSRYHKYTLGAALREGARRVLKLIVRANALCRLAEYTEASRE